MAKTPKTPVIEKISILNGTERTISVIWTWKKYVKDSKKNSADRTKEFTLSWVYFVGDQVRRAGGYNTEGLQSGHWGDETRGEDPKKKYYSATYAAPENATTVKVKIKAIAKTHVVKKKDVPWFTATAYSSEVGININKAITKPPQPPAPTVSLKGTTLTVETESDNSDVKSAEYTVYQNDKPKAVQMAIVQKSTQKMIWTTELAYGARYKVKCRWINNATKEWSDKYSPYSETVYTPPVAPTTVTECFCVDETTAQIKWNAASGADTYEVQAATKKEYFDSSSEVKSQTVSVNYCIFTGLDSGKQWFFRMRSVNSTGQSAWLLAANANTTLGKKPTAPTTWSDVSSIIIGKKITLYWTHNSADGSKQSAAKIKLTSGTGSVEATVTGETAYYELDTTGYDDGAKIKWSVSTKGAIAEYSDYSIEREISVYQMPVLNVTTSIVDAVLSEFPFTIVGTPLPDTQKPVSYNISIVADDGYNDGVDIHGNPIIVGEKEEIYQKVISANEESLNFTLYPYDITFSNNAFYTMTISVVMNSGLKAENITHFSALLVSEDIEPELVFLEDQSNYTMTMMPMCLDEEGGLIPGYTISIFRRNFDGSFTSIIEGVDSASETWVVDKHPALDYGRYRIIAISNSTGAISYTDMPDEPVGCTSVIVQWDETTVVNGEANEDEFDVPAWAGKMLDLPYNIDVSDSFSPDVSLVNYIGREHPVDYYGTQKGFTSNWSMEIPKTDTERLSLVRELASWMGNVYVREPSGTGYYANVQVSYSQTHCEKTIPITFNVTRVEGGM